MAERPNMSELFRRTMQTNIGFYAGLLDLSVNYLKNLGSIFSEAQTSVSTKAQPAQPRTGVSALVLEAEAGERAQAYFLVENQLARKVPAEIIASPIVNADGEEAAQELQFEPSTINLEPGEKIVVQVAAVIDRNLDPGVAYRGSITVPGLSDSPAAIVVRRRHSVEKTGVAEPSRPKRAKRRTPASKSTKAASTKRKVVTRKRVGSS